MSKRIKKWTFFTLRWGIAVAGIWYVVANLSWDDKVTILNSNHYPEKWVVVSLPNDVFDFKSVDILNRHTGEKKTVNRSVLLSDADRKYVDLKEGGKVRLLALNLTEQKPYQVEWFVVEDPAKPDHGLVVGRDAIQGRFDLKVPYPQIEVGLRTMFSRADPKWMWVAFLIFPVTFIMTSYRWHELLKALDIRMTGGRAFVINMVGAFYNTFMPGSTGGDFLKAYYASKQTTHRTRAVMSVLIDRIIGLLALVLLGGAMAAYQYNRYIRAGSRPTDPATMMCWKIALASGGIIGSVIVGLTVFYTGWLRRMVGLDFVMSRLPMQKQVQNAVYVMETYRRRPLLVAWAFLATFPVHITVAASAMFAGWAFKLPIDGPYYFVIVPVIVLAGSIPISPQGAGVMEYFAIKLTEKQNANIGQAFALTMSIRAVQILWNLTGGILVLRGGYHAPTQSEQKEMEAMSDEDRQTGA